MKLKLNNMIKIKLHSITDLITNSSTTIFTYSEGSIVPCKELVNEILKLLGESKTCDDIFELSITSDIQNIIDSFDYSLKRKLSPEEYEALQLPDSNYDQQTKKYTGLRSYALEKLVEDILSKRIPEPAWYKNLTEGIEGDTTLNIVVKEPKYQKLADKIFQFLYSTRAEEGSE